MRIWIPNAALRHPLKEASIIDAFLLDDLLHSSVEEMSCHILGTAKLTAWMSQRRI
jgi:hypothetical protein